MFVNGNHYHNMLAAFVVCVMFVGVLFFFIVFRGPNCNQLKTNYIADLDRVDVSFLLVFFLHSTKTQHTSEETNMLNTSLSLFIYFPWHDSVVLSHHSGWSNRMSTETLCHDKVPAKLNCLIRLYGRRACGVHSAFKILFRSSEANQHALSINKYILESKWSAARPNGLKCWSCTVAVG